jgi:hypothetical protein
MARCNAISKREHGVRKPHAFGLPDTEDSRRQPSGMLDRTIVRLDSAAKNRCAPVVPLATGRQPKSLKSHKMLQLF